MYFRPHAMVREPSPELRAAMRDNRLAHVTRRGTLVVRLLSNHELSHAIYPSEWRVSKPEATSCFRCQPDFSHGVVHEVYDFPEELAAAECRLLLEGAEVHSRRGSYCQVITGHDGERLRPYRRERYLTHNGSYTHPTTSMFTARRLGKLRLYANQAREQGSLTIHRSSVEAVDGLVVVTTELLFQLDNPLLATHKFDQLPEELVAWRPALLAHYERWECDAHDCDGHYHLN